MENINKDDTEAGIHLQNTSATVKAPLRHKNSVLENAGLSSDRWDLRINATIGSYWVPLVSPQLEYGAGISATYYPFKHFGIYGDLMWGQFLYNGKGNPYLGSGSSKIGIGVSYRF